MSTTVSARISSFICPLLVLWLLDYEIRYLGFVDVSESTARRSVMVRTESSPESSCAGTGRIVFDDRVALCECFVHHRDHPGISHG